METISTSEQETKYRDYTHFTTIDKHVIKRIYQRLLSDKITSTDIQIEQVLEELKSLLLFVFVVCVVYRNSNAEGIDHLSFPIPSKSGVAYGTPNSKGFLL